MSLLYKLDPRHWRFVYKTFQSIRHDYFSVDPDDPDVIVDANIEDVRAELGRRHFTNGWEISFNYRGEDLNMRRPEYVDVPQHDYNWFQLHVRGFVRDDGKVGLTAHLELEPTEYPYGHLHELHYSEERGLDMLKKILDDTELTYSDA